MNKILINASALYQEGNCSLMYAITLSRTDRAKSFTMTLDSTWYSTSFRWLSPLLMCIDAFLSHKFTHQLRGEKKIMFFHLVPTPDAEPSVSPDTQMYIFMGNSRFRALVYSKHTRKHRRTDKMHPSWASTQSGEAQLWMKARFKKRNLKWRVNTSDFLFVSHYQQSN